MNGSLRQVGSTLREVLEAINHEPYGIAFLTDQAGILKGVVTDGDARRWLLAGMKLEDRVTQDRLRGDFVQGRKGEPVADLLKKISRKVRIIPLVDDAGRPVDYFRFEVKTHFEPVAQPDLEDVELQFLLDAFLSSWISSKGPYIDRLETEFAAFSQAKYGVAVSNGTVALHLALLALGVGPGDEVIVPDLTFAATINTVLHAGATPVIVDVEREFWTIDPDRIREAITPRTKAIIPVHIYGQPCDMEQIMAIAEERGLFVIEDCAEAHGAEFAGKKVGSMGHISCFSFFANKIMTTGEGGMCLTQDAVLNERLRVLRDHGMSPKRRYWHDVVGFNYRMTNLQAAIGCAQLTRLPSLIHHRQKLEAGYKQLFSGTAGIQWQSDADPRRKRVTWLVSALFEERDRFIEAFAHRQIEVRPFFFPLAAMPLYKPYLRSNKVSAEISGKGLSLPTAKATNLEAIGKAMEDLIFPGLRDRKKE